MSSRTRSVTWTWLSSPLLSLALFGAIIALLAADLVFRLRAHSGSFGTHPFAVSWASAHSGIKGLYSAGFISVLILLFLNLAWASIRDWPEFRKLFAKNEPCPMELKQVLASAKSRERLFILKTKAPYSRDQLKKRVSQWANRRRAGAEVVVDQGPGKELQLAVATGRLSARGYYLARIAILFILFGVGVNTVFGYESTLSLEERKEASVPGASIRVSRFEMDRYEGTDAPRNFSSQLEFVNREAGEQSVSKQEVFVNRPVRFEGLQVHQISYQKTKKLAAALEVRDRASGGVQEYDGLQRGELMAIPGAEFRILDIQGNLEGVGTAVQLEYTEGRSRAQKFWVFNKVPDLDKVHRRRSRYHFRVKEVRPVYRSILSVSRDPGTPFVYFGYLLLAGALFLVLVAKQAIFWFVWRSEEISVIGWSDKKAPFERQFLRVCRKLGLEASDVLG